MLVAEVITLMPNDDWIEANRRYLLAALGCVRNAVRRAVGNANAGGGEGAAALPSAEDDERAVLEAADALPAPSAIETLAAAFGLSPFERGVLLLCAGSSSIPGSPPNAWGGGAMGRRFRPSVRPWPPCPNRTGAPGARQRPCAGGG